MKFDIGGRRNPAGQFGNHVLTAYLFQFPVAAQLLAYGKHVDRLLFHGQIDDCRVDELVFILVEAFGFQYVADDRISIFLEHQCAEYFEIAGLGLKFTQVDPRRDRRIFLAGRGFSAGYDFHFGRYGVCLYFGLQTYKIESVFRS